MTTSGKTIRYDSNNLPNEKQAIQPTQYHTKQNLLFYKRDENDQI